LNLSVENGGKGRGRGKGWKKSKVFPGVLEHRGWNGGHWRLTIFKQKKKNE